MRAIPTDTYGYIALGIGNFIDDLSEGKGFPRCDALRAVVRETPFDDDDYTVVDRVAPLPAGWSRVEL